MSSCRNTTSGVYLHEMKQDFQVTLLFFEQHRRRGKDADGMRAREGHCVQDDDGAQASGAFCQVVRIQSVHVPGDQRQFVVVVLLWGFVSGGRTGSSQVYTAGFSASVY